MIEESRRDQSEPAADATGHALAARLGLDSASQNAWVAQHGLPDGLPVPPPELIRLVTGQESQGAFYYNGVQGASCIVRILASHGLDPASFEAVLDFGMGCGRILRHWRRLAGPALYGTDYNPRLVEWVRTNLPFAECGENGLLPPLNYRSGQFDFIYGISVLTHLAEGHQRPWIEEFARVLRPGGYLLLSLHGPIRLGTLSSEQRREFEAGRLVVIAAEASGTNDCGAYHPIEWVRTAFARAFELVDFVPWGAQDANQDVALLRRH